MRICCGVGYSFVNFGCGVFSKWAALDPVNTPPPLPLCQRWCPYLAHISGCSDRDCSTPLRCPPGRSSGSGTALWVGMRAVGRSSERAYTKDAVERCDEHQAPAQCSAPWRTHWASLLWSLQPLPGHPEISLWVFLKRREMCLRVPPQTPHIWVRTDRGHLRLFSGPSRSSEVSDPNPQTDNTSPSCCHRPGLAESLCAPGHTWHPGHRRAAPLPPAPHRPSVPQPPPWVPETRRHASPSAAPDCGAFLSVCHTDRSVLSRCVCSHPASRCRWPDGFSRVAEQDLSVSTWTYDNLDSVGWVLSVSSASRGMPHRFTLVARRPVFLHGARSMRRRWSPFSGCPAASERNVQSYGALNITGSLQREKAPHSHCSVVANSIKPQLLQTLTLSGDPAQNIVKTAQGPVSVHTSKTDKKHHKVFQSFALSVSVNPSLLPSPRNKSSQCWNTGRGCPWRQQFRASVPG